MDITPNRKYSKYFDRLIKDRIVYTNDKDFTRMLGKKYPMLFDKNKGFMDIARIYKRNESAIILRPNVGLAPIHPPTSLNINKRYKFFRIF